MRNPIWWVLIALGIFAFYWFEIRPSEIRKACYIEASDKAKNHMKEMAAQYPDDDSIQAAAKKDWSNKKVFDEYYKSCLNKHGLRE